MDLNSFKIRIGSISKDTQSLINIIDVIEHKKQLRDFKDSLKGLTQFVEDDSNIAVLNNHIENDNDLSETCPLDGLCQSIIEKLKDIDALLKTDILYSFRPKSSLKKVMANTSNGQDFYLLSSKLKDKSFLDLLSAFTVLKHLDGHSKTLIILGSNGSGKTSFANYLKNMESHVKVIPASKPIKMAGHIPSMFNASLTNYNDELYRGGLLNQDLLQKLIVGMCNEHDDIARNYMRTGVKEKETTFEQVKAVFDSFFDVELDDSFFSFKEIKAKKEGGSPFSFNDMSDGERVAFFYIATVLAAPNNSFVIVDEPENHLNPAIYNKIWDKLIELRNDCQFVFITHTMDFVCARSNYEIVKIKSFVYPDKFEFVFLGDSLDSIPTEMVLEIIGSRKPILFCEGSKTDYDYKVYESIFGSEYTVIPTGNCISVEKSVEASNLHSVTYGIQSAIGIIDSDLKGEEETERLKGKGIYTLRCNEIEMLLIDDVLFKKVLLHVFKRESLFEEFQNCFFKKIEERSQHIVRRLVKTRIDEKLNNSFIDDKSNKTKEDIKNSITKIVNDIDIDRIWQECETTINRIILQRNYDEALRFCCLEHGEIISGIGNIYVKDYPDIALGLLRTDDTISEHIRNKYFHEICNFRDDVG